VCIRFVDTGCGIPADILPRIFEPFFTTKEPGRGTGLGLATTYGIIKQSGGFIFADSTAGRGATFAIYLPRAAKADPVAETRPLPGPTTKAQGTVLVVEDDSRIRALIRQILGRPGYSVLTAGSGQEALSLLAENGQVDLILADIVMPGMSLHELLEQLRTRRPQLPVVLMSGYSTEILRGPVPDESFPLLEKPFTQEELLLTVQQALERGATPAAGAAGA
jgi:two-component system cell cycle sensor histidine kinase/response regulator CckA